MGLNFWINIIGKEWDKLTGFPLLAGALFCAGAMIFFFIAKLFYHREMSAIKAESLAIKEGAALYKTERDRLRQEIDQRVSQPRNAYQPDGKNSELFGEISLIYNDIGLLVKNCYHLDPPEGTEKSKKIGSLLDIFIENLIKNRLSLPHDIIIMFEKLFDALSGYKLRADFIINSRKSIANYNRWKEMNIDFSMEATSLFDNLEHKMRNQTPPHITTA